MKTISLLLLSILMMSTTNLEAKKKKKAEDVEVEILTSAGIITVKLYADVPQHTANFIKLVNDGTYDGTLFHRVIRSFMIQGGDPDSKNAEPGKRLGMGDLGYKIPAEFNTKHIHLRGALAAARDNNPEKASSSCQFYIVQGKKYPEDQMRDIARKNNLDYTPEQIKAYEEVGGAPFLDMNYTVFGEVVDGIDVVDAIASMPVDASDRPKEDVSMTMRVKKKRKKFLGIF